MRIYARYDLPCELYEKDADGVQLTRREKYALMGIEDELEKPPELEIPDNGLYLWRLFSEANAAVPRFANGAFHVIPPSEWSAWMQLTAHDVSFEEWEILHAIDLVYCDELNKDIAAMRAKQEAEDAKRRGK